MPKMSLKEIVYETIADYSLEGYKGYEINDTVRLDRLGFDNLVLCDVALALEEIFEGLHISYEEIDNWMYPLDIFTSIEESVGGNS